MNTHQSINSLLRVTKARASHEVSKLPLFASIRFDHESGTLIIKGPIDEQELPHFYFPVMSQLAMHLAKNEPLIIGLFMRDLNMPSLKIIFDLFSLVQKQQRKGSTIIVKWFVNSYDLSVQETAKDFETLFDLNSEIIPTRVEC